MSGSETARALREQALALPDTSRERVRLLTDAARHAEADGDEALCFELRRLLIDDGLAAGEIHVALSAFSWCLALCDEKPEAYAEEKLHWRFKWVLQWAPRFPEVSRRQVEVLMEDVTRRFRRRGIGENALAKLQAFCAVCLFDTSEIASRLEAWKRTPRDRLSDCWACDQDEEVGMLLRLGREGEALTAARSLIARKVSCAEVPDLTYAQALPALVRAGHAAEALEWHRRGYRLLQRHRRKLVGYYGQHLLALAVLNDTGRGLRLLREGLPLAAEHPVQGAQLEFYLGAEVLLERIARSTEELRLTLPAALGGNGSAAPVSVTELMTKLAARADALTAAYDARNGNDGCSKLAAEWRSYRELSLELPKEESPS